MHEAVAREAGDHVVARQLGRAADDRVGVGRVLIEARPVRGPAGIGQQGQPLDGPLHVRVLPRHIHAFIEARRLVGVGLAGEQPLAFAVKIEALGEVDDERKIRGQIGQGRGGENLAADGRDRQGNVGHIAHQPGPGTGRVDHHFAGDGTGRGLHALDAPSLHVDFRHFHIRIRVDA